jgi:tRNA(Arg) A34 adenosine deaminase TadA
MNRDQFMKQAINLAYENTERHNGKPFAVVIAGPKTPTMMIGADR